MAVYLTTSNINLSYKILMSALNFLLFVIEIGVAHICHSLLLNIDALFRLSQAILLVIQLLSAKFFHLFPVQNTFGLARIGLIAELINIIFLAAMMISIALESVKHIVDNITYNRLVLAGTLLNSTRPSIKGHQHFLIHRPDVLAYTGLCILLVNILQVSLFISTKTLSKFHSRNKIYETRENLLSFKFVATASDIISRKDVILQIFCQLFGSTLVLACGLIVLQRKDSTLSRYADSILTFIFIAIGILTLVPIVREGIFVLLQNFPDSMCVTNIKSKIMKEVPEVVNVHDLHIWQHIPFSYVCTVHVVLHSTLNFKANMKLIAQVLLDLDIYHFIIQPEFLQSSDVLVGTGSNHKCLIKCPEECDAVGCCNLEYHDDCLTDRYNETCNNEQSLLLTKEDISSAVEDSYQCCCQDTINKDNTELLLGLNICKSDEASSVASKLTRK